MLILVQRSGLATRALWSRDFDAEQLRQVFATEDLRRAGLCHAAAGVRDEILLVNVTQLEQKFGTYVEPRTNSV